MSELKTPSPDDIAELGRWIKANPTRNLHNEAEQRGLELKDQHFDLIGAAAGLRQCRRCETWKDPQEWSSPIVCGECLDQELEED